MTAPDSPVAPASPSHVVDELIEDRAPELIHTPVWPAIKAVGYPLLGYRTAVEMADEIAEKSGTDCLDWTAEYLRLRVETSGLEHVPKSGGCVIVANHPGGIADGLALWQIMREHRHDMLFFANRDALKVCPGLEERIIPVEWRDEDRGRMQSRDLLKRTIEEFRSGKCIVIFPSGRMSEWNWSKMGLREKPWQPTAVSFARKFGVPIIPLAVRQRMPLLYYALAQIHEELKDMTIFQGLIGKKNSRYQLAFGRAMEFTRDDGSDAELTEMVREICETRAWRR